MATYDIASTEQGAYEKTLAASTVDTITFVLATNKGARGWVGPPKKFEVINEGTVGIYGTHDGTAPTVGGAGCWYIPPTSRGVVSVKDPDPDDEVVVKLISSGTPKYSVARAQ
jgi:hypothetical protein